MATRSPIDSAASAGAAPRLEEASSKLASSADKKNVQSSISVVPHARLDLSCASAPHPASAERESAHAPPSELRVVAALDFFRPTLPADPAKTACSRAVADPRAFLHELRAFAANVRSARCWTAAQDITLLASYAQHAHESDLFPVNRFAIPNADSSNKTYAQVQDRLRRLKRTADVQVDVGVGAHGIELEVARIAAFGGCWCVRVKTLHPGSRAKSSDVAVGDWLVRYATMPASSSLLLPAPDERGLADVVRWLSSRVQPLTLSFTKPMCDEHGTLLSLQPFFLLPKAALSKAATVACEMRRIVYYESAFRRALLLDADLLGLRLQRIQWRRGSWTRRFPR